jgi:ribosomal protein S18 acetylase RimI-like enzyme
MVTEPVVRLLTDAEREAAGDVAARALRDDPLLVFLEGDDRLARMRASYAIFPPSVTYLASAPWAAVLDGHVIAVAGAAPPGTCFVTRLEPDRPSPADASSTQWTPTERMARVMTDWRGHHTDERHWHVGPVGVEPGLQGLGVGSLVMRSLCECFDADGEVAWLETERPENVVFYRRLGFDVVSESQLDAMHTWFMRREPQ